MDRRYSAPFLLADPVALPLDGKELICPQGGENFPAGPVPGGEAHHRLQGLPQGAGEGTAEPSRAVVGEDGGLARAQSHLGRLPSAQLLGHHRHGQGQGAVFVPKFSLHSGKEAGLVLQIPPESADLVGEVVSGIIHQLIAQGGHLLGELVHLVLKGGVLPEKPAHHGYGDDSGENVPGLFIHKNTS